MMTYAKDLYPARRMTMLGSIALAALLVAPLAPAAFNGLDTLGSAYARRGADDGPNDDRSKSGRDDNRHRGERGDDDHRGGRDDHGRDGEGNDDHGGRGHKSRDDDSGRGHKSRDDDSGRNHHGPNHS